jgi:phosphoenolpyruvate---glycerone phosphotransferase subunit DhaL
MMAVDGAKALAWLQRVADALRANREYLTELDAAIGDADHGTNMDRGFTAVMAKLHPAGAAPPDPSAMFKTVGTTLVSTVGGAAGPLYGTAFMRAGAALAGKETLEAGDIAAALDAALEGIKARGRATRGEKTMIDALEPAIEAYKASLAGGGDLSAALRAAADAAEEGMRATIPMLATKGRASYLGERSIGHQDPGATSTALLLRTMTSGEEGA